MVAGMGTGSRVTGTSVLVLPLTLVPAAGKTATWR